MEQEEPAQPPQGPPDLLPWSAAGTEHRGRDAGGADVPEVSSAPFVLSRLEFVLFTPLWGAAITLSVLIPLALAAPQGLAFRPVATQSVLIFTLFVLFAALRHREIERQVEVFSDGRIRIRTKMSVADTHRGAFFAVRRRRLGWIFMLNWCAGMPLPERALPPGGDDALQRLSRTPVTSREPAAAAYVIEEHSSLPHVISFGDLWRIVAGRMIPYVPFGVLFAVAVTLARGRRPPVAGVVSLCLAGCAYVVLLAALAAWHSPRRTNLQRVSVVPGRGIRVWDESGTTFLTPDRLRVTASRHGIRFRLRVPGSGTCFLPRSAFTNAAHRSRFVHHLRSLLAEHPPPA